MRNTVFDKNGNVVEDIELTEIGGKVIVRDILYRTTRDANTAEIAQYQAETKANKRQTAKDELVVLLKSGTVGNVQAAILSILNYLELDKDK